MKWYRTADHDELINLEIVESVRLKEKSINFDFYGEESRFIAEIFETEEIQTLEFSTDEILDIYYSKMDISELYKNKKEVA